MSSIGAIASAAHGVSRHEKDGYCAKDGAAHREASARAGRGAESFGLSGPVAPDVFRAVLENKVPDGSGRELGRRDRGGRLRHRPGREVTAARAEVGLARRPRRRRRWPGSRPTPPRPGRRTRRRAGWSARAGQGMVAAIFRRDSSRDLDSRLHAHAVAANRVRGGDGEWRSMANEKLYESKMLIGAIYRSELARGFSRLGYEIEKTHADGRFERAGAACEFIDSYSTRRAETEAGMAERGTGSPPDNPCTAERAALMSRATRRDIDREELGAHWQRQVPPNSASTRPRSYLRPGARNRRWPSGRPYRTWP